MAELLGWCAQGKLSAHVHAVYPLDKTADAIKALADRKVMGKVIVRP
jgi:NADPH2:quinone reductase